jgi:hypothetical protein
MPLCKLFPPLCVHMIESWPAEMGYSHWGRAGRPATFHYMHVLNYPRSAQCRLCGRFRQQSSPYLFPCINVLSVHDVCVSTFIPRWTLFFCQQIADFVKSSVADWITKVYVRVRARKFSPASFQAIKLFGHRSFNQRERKKHSAFVVFGLFSRAQMLVVSQQSHVPEKGKFRIVKQAMRVSSIWLPSHWFISGMPTRWKQKRRVMIFRPSFRRSVISHLLGLGCVYVALSEPK